MTSDFEKTGFADMAASQRKIKMVFFNQINTLIDWRPISNIINKHYQKGESAVGRPSYPGLLLFKITLLWLLPEQKSNQSISWLQDDVDDEKYPGITLDPVVCVGTRPYKRPYNLIWESVPSNNNSN